VAITDTERSLASSICVRAAARAPSNAAIKSSLGISASDVFSSRWMVLTFSATGVAHHSRHVSDARPASRSAPNVVMAPGSPSMAADASSKTRSLPKRRGAAAGSSERNLYHHVTSIWPSTFETSRV